MQTSEWVFPLDFHWMWCCVQHIRCASHHGSLAHIQAFVNKAMTQREAKPQEGSTRDQQESVKTGGIGELSTSRQVKHTYCMVGQCRKLRSLGQVSFLLQGWPFSIAALHTSLLYCLAVLWEGCWELWIQLVQQHPLLPFPSKMGQAGTLLVELAEGTKPSLVMCHLRFLKGSWALGSTRCSSQLLATILSMRPSPIERAGRQGSQHNRSGMPGRCGTYHAWAGRLCTELGQRRDVCKSQAGGNARSMSSCPGFAIKVTTTTGKLVCTTSVQKLSQMHWLVSVSAVVVLRECTQVTAITPHS